MQNASARYDILSGWAKLALPVMKTFVSAMQDRDCEVIFFATPHRLSMYQAATFLERGIKVIDLSADFRLKNVDVYHKWYGIKHKSKNLISKSIYS